MGRSCPLGKPIRTLDSPHVANGCCQLFNNKMYILTCLDFQTSISINLKGKVLCVISIIFSYCQPIHWIKMLTCITQCHLLKHCQRINPLCIFFPLKKKIKDLHVIPAGPHPFTLGISLVILATVCYAILIMLVQIIWYWINYSSNNNLML